MSCLGPAELSFSPSINKNLGQAWTMPSLMLGNAKGGKVMLGCAATGTSLNISVIIICASVDL